MNRQWSSLGLFVVLAMVGVGCGDDDRPTPPTDGGRPPIELGPADGGPDGATDAGRDGGTVSTCAVGRPCDARGCNPATLACEGERVIPQGDPPDLIFLPDGGTVTFEQVFFQDGVCTNAAIGTAAATLGGAGACDPEPADDTPGADGCPACAKCISLGGDGRGGEIVQCYERCTPSETGNPCRDGWTCDLASQVCIFGCTTDEQCQVYQEDTNGDGTLDEPADGGVRDRTLLDIAGGATCNRATGRCTQPGTPGAEAGDNCTRDSQCEEDGRCLDELRFSAFPGGYCSKNGCDLLGCEGDGKCLDVGGGANLCLAPCKIADDVGDPETGATGGDDDCQVGFACFWDGTSTVAAPVNGGCLPGNYNPVTVENIGAACNDPDGPAGDGSSDDQCWSPYGLGRCVFAEEVATCTVLGCSNLPTDACGAGNECVALGGTTTLCLRTCTAPTDCSADGGRAAHGCVALSTDPAAPKHCFPGCQVDGDCNTAYRCDGATAMALGECVLR